MKKPAGTALPARRCEVRGPDLLPPRSPASNHKAPRSPPPRATGRLSFQIVGCRTRCLLTITCVESVAGQNGRTPPPALPLGGGYWPAGHGQQQRLDDKDRAFESGRASKANIAFLSDFLDRRRRQQVGALPCRMSGDACPEVLLITSRQRRRWANPGA